MSSTQTKPAVRRFPHQLPLDGLRGLAAIGVFCHHALWAGLPDQGLTWHQSILRNASFYGAYGVTLFFVLSGYLITSLLLLDRRAPNYFHNFYWKRVFRVLPPLVLVLGLTWAMGYTEWTTIVLALLFILNFNEMLHIPASGPFWSLSIEEQFYLVWPAVIRFLSARVMRNAMLVVVIAQPFVRALSVALGHGRTHYTFMQTDGLAWGALLAIAAYSLRVPYRNHGQRKLVRVFGLGPLVAGALLTIVSEWMSWHGHQTYLLSMEGVTLFFTGLMAYMIAYPQCALGRLLSVKPLLYFGSISYMMYLIHAYVLAFYDEHVHPQTVIASQLYLRFAIAFVVTLLFCTASLYLFERPVNRLRRFVVRGR